MITVTVKVWSALAPQFGLEGGRAHHLALDLPAGSTLGDLLNQLSDQYPLFGALVSRPGLVLVTLNADVEPDPGRLLYSNDEIGVVPAYQGG